jgi:DNA-binding CsgD family transcriptional regulator
VNNYLAGGGARLDLAVWLGSAGWVEGGEPGIRGCSQMVVRRPTGRKRPLSREGARLSSILTGRELAEVLSFCNDCLLHENEAALHRSILDFGLLVGFEFVLYAFMDSTYERSRPVLLKNLSNPAVWMAEYDERGYLSHDPVRRELELRLARGETHGVILWDAYDRKLNDVEKEIIARRTHYGLRYGLSAFCDSSKQDALFLVSFASATKPVDERALLLSKLIAPHLTRCRKRLDLARRVRKLTRRERSVAKWLVEGKTNREIARILEVAEATAKFHVANILAKLEAGSRQTAVGVLIAERCLS